MSDVFINKYLLKFLTWLFDLTKLSGQFNSEEDVNFKANVKIKYGPKGKCNVSHEDGEFELQFNFYDVPSVDISMVLTPKEFLNQISNYDITNSNTKLISTVVNGCVSNVGIDYNRFVQGELQLERDEFEQFSAKNDVKVLVEYV